ncbi:MAG: hypothetical protein KKE57_07470, partial [Proteobacteria bacterium]|nr:hypothetical protein [Pseudomonadota bacterium]
GRSFSPDSGDRVSNTCPECGKSFPQSAPREGGSKKDLSDSLIEATYEVLAEEGAIWSGAR